MRPVLWVLRGAAGRGRGKGGLRADRLVRERDEGGVVRRRIKIVWVFWRRTRWLRACKSEYLKGRETGGMLFCGGGGGHCAPLNSLALPLSRYTRLSPRLFHSELEYTSRPLKRSTPPLKTIASSQSPLYFPYPSTLLCPNTVTHVESTRWQPCHFLQIRARIT